MSRSIYIIAGEPSGDQLGHYLIAGLREECGENGVTFSGVGGAMMGQYGFNSLFPMEDLSVMGLTEVLPRLPKILSRISQTAADILTTRPDVLITIDSPDFCLRVAKKVKKALPNLKIVHYVAPSVWAWRPKRAAKMARVVDHVLALLPFEPPYMEAAGMSCDFVGHPIARVPMVSVADAQAFRTSYGIALDAPLLCLLPGSRRGEIARQGAIYRETAEVLARDHHGLRVVLPAAAPVYRDVLDLVAGMRCDPIVLDPQTTDMAQKMAAFAASDVALASSGTVSLELARQSVPMVIGYQMAPISRAITRRLVRLDSVTLVNIVTQSRAVPEFLFEDFTVEKIAPAVSKYLRDSVAAKVQTAVSSDAIRQLGGEGLDPGLLAARSVLSVLN